MIIFCQNVFFIMVMKINLFKPSNIKGHYEKNVCLFVTNFTIS